MLVEGNLRFVVKEARKFQGMGLDLLDLISEGNLGLIEAAKRFDPERENKFLTYASWWVRQAIFHALAEHGSKIRLPQKVAGHLVQLNRITHRLGQDLGRVPTVQDIVDASHFSAEEVERLQLLQQTTSTVSTEQGMGESDLTLGDSLEQTIEPSPMDTMDQESFLDQVRLSLGLLEREGAPDHRPALRPGRHGPHDPGAHRPVLRPAHQPGAGAPDRGAGLHEDPRPAPGAAGPVPEGGPFVKGQAGLPPVRGAGRGAGSRSGPAGPALRLRRARRRPSAVLEGIPPRYRGGQPGSLLGVVEDPAPQGEARGGPGQRAPAAGARRTRPPCPRSCAPSWT